MVGRGVCVVEHGAELSTLVVGHGEVVEHLDHVISRGCTRLFQASNATHVVLRRQLNMLDRFCRCSCCRSRSSRLWF